MTQKVNPPPVRSTIISQVAKMKSRTSQSIFRDKSHMTSVLMLFQFYCSVGLRLYLSASTDYTSLKVQTIPLCKYRLYLSASTDSNGSIFRHLDDRRIDYGASEMRNYLEEPAQSERCLGQCQFVQHKTYTDSPGS